MSVAVERIWRRAMRHGEGIVVDLPQGVSRADEHACFATSEEDDAIRRVEIDRPSDVTSGERGVNDDAFFNSFGHAIGHTSIGPDEQVS